MRVITKILLSIAIFCGGSLFVTLIVRGMGNQRSSGGIGPFIIYPMIIAGIWAVWKYNPEKKEDDKHTLNKS
jgi:hypothetical protein